MAIVKDIYRQLEIEAVFEKYESQSKERIEALIAKVDESLLPKEMFTKFLNRIFKVRIQVNIGCAFLRNLLPISLLPCYHRGKNRNIDFQSPSS